MNHLRGVSAAPKSPKSIGETVARPMLAKPTYVTWHSFNVIHSLPAFCTVLIKNGRTTTLMSLKYLVVTWCKLSQSCVVLSERPIAETTGEQSRRGFGLQLTKAKRKCLRGIEFTRLTTETLMVRGSLLPGA